MKVLLADMMVYPVYAALQVGKESLDAVRCDTKSIFVPNVFILKVVNLIVPPSFQGTLKGGGAVRHHMGVFRKLSMRYGFGSGHDLSICR